MDPRRQTSLPCLTGTLLLMTLATAGLTGCHGNLRQTEGRQQAEVDLRQGQVRYAVRGLAQPDDARLAEQMSSLYGVTLCSTGCLGTPDPAYEDGYQAAVVDYLTTTYGRDVVAERNTTTAALPPLHVVTELPAEERPFRALTQTDDHRTARSIFGPVNGIQTTSLDTMILKWFSEDYRTLVYHADQTPAQLTMRLVPIRLIIGQGQVLDARYAPGNLVIDDRVFRRN